MSTHDTDIDYCNVLSLLFHFIVSLSLTVDVEHSHVRFLGNLVLNLWDCGGYVAFVVTHTHLLTFTFNHSHSHL